jgi:hypothetical protein
MVCGFLVSADMVLPEHPPIAVEEVCFAGEPVACLRPASAWSSCLCS